MRALKLHVVIANLF